MESASTVTYQSIASAIWHVERQLNPWAWQSTKEAGLWHWWPLIRMKLYYRLGHLAGVFDLSYSTGGPKQSVVMSKYAWLGQGLRWQWGVAKGNALHVEGDRRDAMTGEDVYLAPWYSQPHMGVVWSQQPVADSQRPKWAWATGRRLVGIPTVSLPEQLDAQTLDRCQQVSHELFQQLAIKVDVADLVLPALRAAIRQHAYATGMIRCLRPSQVRLTCAYGKEGLIWAAKQANVPVIEVQHGTVHPYHLGYAYPPECRVKNRTPDLHPYLPDRFACWGRFWSETVALPWLPAQIDYIGYSVFRDARKQYVNVPRNRQCVVLSQPVLLPQLVQALLSSPLPMPVVYKCHPHELASTDPSLQTALQQLAEHPNIQIAPPEKPLYELLAESEYCAGVFSSALYEALGMGCKSVLMDLPGLEAMSPLRERYPQLPVWPLNGDWSTCFAQADGGVIHPDDFF